MDYFFAVLMILSGACWVYVTGVRYIEECRYYPHPNERRRMLVGVLFAVTYFAAAGLAALRGLLA